MSKLIFKPFEKLGRMKRGCTITEKIDGTNAQICFGEDGDILVGSRKRQIWPENWKKTCDGQACKCLAHVDRECCCPDADWTPREVYELRLEVNALLEEANC